MSFDKAKAMRSAERYVAQGKIHAAIGEYRAVVENDPRDIATLNMLGDLHAKNAEKRDAVKCYLQVADHYSTQGFAQKAIAIYNKISRIQPDSLDVSAKLAELHRAKGSLSEARSHYEHLAEHYQKTGKRLEALAMFKQIAMLDPNNTDVCMSLADSYLRENQRDDAVEAYAEAGARFARQNRHEEAIRALMKGFDINSTDLRILGGLVKAQTALGRASKAVSLLEEILENEPFNRDVLYLLIECCLDSQNAAGAEAAVVKLVEIEPANYPKFLDLVRIYLNGDDPDSAARILNMSVEYLLAGGNSEDCGKWISEILERNPDQLAALTLLVRYNSWLNDETGTRLALERLYLSASKVESVEDERFALLQLVKIRPHETRYRDRLNEINAECGYAAEDTAEIPPAVDHEVREPSFDLETFHSNGHVPADVLNAEIVERINDEPEPHSAAQDISHADELRVQREIESIDFYIENDYKDLAIKALAELVQEFGERAEFAEIRDRMNGAGAPADAQIVAPVAPVESELAGNAIGIDEIRSEFGLDDADTGSGDYDTHYHTAVAYQEMGLYEQAIAEFQDAINCTRPSDGTRRFFYCSNLLGHCFLQNGRPNHAITWFIRALETPGISDEEQHGVWYEMALAYQANGDLETAGRYFEQIYAEHVDFRDVAERVKELVGNR